LQACVEKKYGGMAPKKPLISKVGENEFQKKTFKYNCTAINRIIATLRGNKLNNQL
jgi:hypothetical protein